MLRTFEENGLIERRTPKTNGRAKCVQITKIGIKKLNEALEFGQQEDENFFRQLKRRFGVKKELINLFRGVFNK